MSKDMAELLAAAGKGRMDTALALAKPLASEAGEEPSRFVARACSDHAAERFTGSKEARDRGIGLAVTGATFDLPGRITPKPSHLKEGFWLKDVSDQYESAKAISQLARASLALRGLDGPAEAVESLQQRSQAGGENAKIDVIAAARDYQILGKVAVLQLLTSRPCSVLQAWMGRAFSEEEAGVMHFPALFTLIMKVNRHLMENLTNAEPHGPLENLTDDLDLAFFKKWADNRQKAASTHLRMVSEITSEAATSFVKEPAEKKELLLAAVGFYTADCPLAERQKAVKVFRDTADRLGIKLKIA